MNWDSLHEPLALLEATREGQGWRKVAFAFCVYIQLQQIPLRRHRERGRETGRMSIKNSEPEMNGFEGNQKHKDERVEVSELGLCGSQWGGQRQVSEYLFIIVIKIFG